VLDPAGAFVFGNENKNMLSSSSQLNMNGYDQKVSRIYRRWADEADASNYVTLNSPSTGAVLTIENKETFNDRLPMRVLNGAGLAFNAAGSLELVQNNTPFVSTTTGRLAVARGTLRFGAGVSWPNVSSIELTGGALVLSETTASLAFGPAAGKSSARMIRDGGTLEIPAGETACVYSCSWHNEKGNMRHLDPGVYGGSEAGLSTKYTLDWITGGGMLKVLCSEAPGTVIIVR
jgi:hypothetical protein